MRTTWITCITVENIGSVVLKQAQKLSLFFNQFNSLFDETNLHDDDVDKIHNCIIL